MSFTPILIPQDFAGTGAMSLPNQPAIPPETLKATFDSPARQVCAPATNRLIGELEATTASQSLGAQAPAGRGTATTVQGVLNKLSTDLATLEAAAGTAIADAHTHTNKTLLDTYAQTETDLADAVTKKHDHSNKSLLDTYSQTEANLSDAVSKKHDHSNKSLLDSYSQTEANLADAVSKKHSHSNQSLLDTYTQTEANLADAVSKKHSHANKTYIDKIGEDSSGNPTYDGNPIGGGGAADTFKNFVSGGTTFVASGDNDTFKINAGSNVTITPLTSPDKGIVISASGGGTSTGDMLMSQYDQSGDVKAASSTGNGIKDFVAAEIGKLDVSDSAVSGQYVSAVSEADGKISVTRASLPTITDTYSGTSSDGMSGKAVKSAIDALDVSDSAVSGQYVSAVSETDGKISVTRASLPTVPTITDTYSSSSHDGMSGVAVASAISGKANTSALDDWVKTASVSSGSVTFSGIDDSGNYGYEVFFKITSSSTNKNPSAQLSAISGEGTSNMSLTYTTDADNGTNNAKLRRIK